MAFGRGMFNLMNTNFNLVNPNLIAMEEVLNAEDVVRLRKYLTNWNYYNGYHWEEIEASDKPEVTENWCRKFVNKFVEAEFNSGFSIKMNENAEEQLLPFLKEVWEDNAGDRTLNEMGQMKSVTGDAYLHILYEPKFINGQLNPNFEDPFGLYESGRIRVIPVPSSICYPRYKDGYDMYNMESCAIMFPVRLDNGFVGASTGNRYTIMKYEYTKDRIQIYRGKDLIADEPNPYGIIPIVHFKNVSLAGAHFGISDLDDIIPLNTELNLKNSDTSEILDYHSSPITAIFGARVSQLEKGANKVWGGLPKDAKIQNIELDSDLAASKNYKDDIRQSMFKIGSIPEVAIGGDLASNLSGVALQIAFMPLTDAVKTKWKFTKESLKLVNNIILKIAIQEGLVEAGELKPRDIYSLEIIAGDLLPKDKVQELEQIQQELKMGLDSRKNVMKRLKRNDIESLIKEIDKDRDEKPLVYGVAPVLVAAGQQLVNPETGETIVTNDSNIKLAQMNIDSQQKISKMNAQNTIQATGGKTSQPPQKPVGTNKEGGDLKVNSGVTNTNPGKNS